jgi:hypothetical protein
MEDACQKDIKQLTSLSTLLHLHLGSTFNGNHPGKYLSFGNYGV